MSTGSEMQGWAVVTGASSGIGRAFARELARRGNRVLGIARRGDRLEALAREMEKQGRDVEPLSADLTTAEGLDEVVRRLAELPVEILINNAGNATGGDFQAAPLDEELGSIRLNVEAVVTLTRAVLPGMVHRTMGRSSTSRRSSRFSPFPISPFTRRPRRSSSHSQRPLPKRLRGPTFASWRFVQVPRGRRSMSLLTTKDCWAGSPASTLSRSQPPRSVRSLRAAWSRLSVGSTRCSSSRTGSYLGGRSASSWVPRPSLPCVGRSNELDFAGNGDALNAERRSMRTILVIYVTGLTLCCGLLQADAEDLSRLFRSARDSVAMIRATGRDVSAGGEIPFQETGSGVLISSDGKVMTAAHVVQSVDEIRVEFLGGDAVHARVIASEPAADLSLLQLEKVPLGARVAMLADSDTVQVGEQVIVVGAPYGLSHSLSVGWISARWAPNTVYRRMPLAEFFQISAPINMGNSGGPMFNMAGQVIGLVSHNISKSGGNEGLGFVVAINTAKRLLLDKKSFWSGLEGEILSDELADILNLPPGTGGYLIRSVAKNSPAEKIGLRGGTKLATIDGQSIVLGGDVLLRVEGIAAGSLANLIKIRSMLAGLKPGTPFKASILRAGRVLELTGRTTDAK